VELVGRQREDVLWLVRHGESTWNAIGRMQRQIAHPPLTARGIAQAYAAGYRLRGNTICRIITSDAVRSTQTARAIGTVIGIEPTVDGRLRERGWSENQRPTSLRHSGPERLEDPVPRITSVLTNVADLPGPSLLVTHGDIVCTILDLLRSRNEVTRSWHSGIAVPNGAVLGVKLNRCAFARGRR
jgi:broad specificity phosphatase PhoE